MTSVTMDVEEIQALIETLVCGQDVTLASVVSEGLQRSIFASVTVQANGTAVNVKLLDNEGLVGSGSAFWPGATPPGASLPKRADEGAIILAARRAIDDHDAACHDASRMSDERRRLWQAVAAFEIGTAHGIACEWSNVWAPSLPISQLKEVALRWSLVEDDDRLNPRYVGADQFGGGVEMTSRVGGWHIVEFGS